MDLSKLTGRPRKTPPSPSPRGTGASRGDQRLLQPPLGPPVAVGEHAALTLGPPVAVGEHAALTLGPPVAVGEHAAFLALREAAVVHLEALVGRKALQETADGPALLLAGGGMMEGGCIEGRMEWRMEGKIKKERRSTLVGLRQTSDHPGQGSVRTINTTSMVQHKLQQKQSSTSAIHQ